MLDRAPLFRVPAHPNPSSVTSRTLVASVERAGSRNTVARGLQIGHSHPRRTMLKGGCLRLLLETVLDLPDTWPPEPAHREDGAGVIEADGRRV